MTNPARLAAACENTYLSLTDPRVFKSPVIQDLRQEVNRLRWFHEIDFGNGILSPGATKIDKLQDLADIYFRHGVVGKSFLDVGCWDGFNSFEANKRGASKVLATDYFAWHEPCWGDRRAFELGRACLAPFTPHPEIPGRGIFHASREA